MISNNLLADRLNLYRQDPKNFDTSDLDVDLEPVNGEFLDKVSWWADFVIGSVMAVGQSIIYGFGIQTLLGQDWKFLAMAAVGVTFYGILETIRSAFTK